MDLRNLDQPGEGFNDATPVLAVGSNLGSTLGAQRWNALRYAAEHWARRLVSPVPIVVAAKMDPLPCTAGDTVLGQAKPREARINVAGAAMPADVWHPGPLAEALAGRDLSSGLPDIEATFNSALDAGCLTDLEFWYGLYGTAPAGTVDFKKVALHELAHGLGFTTFADLTSGALLAGFGDVFVECLLDTGSGLRWPALSDADRVQSAVSGQVRWDCDGVTSRSPALLSQGVDVLGRVPISSPPVLVEGLSIVHWDASITPDDLLEPPPPASAGLVITPFALEDLGWELPAGPCVPTPTTLCLHDDRFAVVVRFGTRQGGGVEGVALATPLETLGAGQGGIFTFLDATNPELLVKVIEGCGAPGSLSSWWTFFAATTNFGFEVEVTDTSSGVTRIYQDPDVTNATTVLDTASIPCDVSVPAETPPAGAAGTVLAPEAAGAAVSAMDGPTARAARVARAGTCQPGATVGCLHGGRFRLELEYSTTQGGGRSGAGMMQPLQPLGIDQGAVVTFLDPTNPELLVKVIEGCGAPGALSNWWVFFAATTNFGFELTVTDTEAGLQKVYGNPDRTTADAVTDTAAFPCG